jgi:hypothetical protein
MSTLINIFPSASRVLEAEGKTDTKSMTPVATKAPADKVATLMSKIEAAEEVIRKLTKEDAKFTESKKYKGMCISLAKFEAELAELITPSTGSSTNSSASFAPVKVPPPVVTISKEADRLAKVKKALERTDKPLTEDARARLEREQTLLQSILDGTADAEDAYNTFLATQKKLAETAAAEQKAAAEIAAATAAKAAADAEEADKRCDALASLKSHFAGFLLDLTTLNSRTNASFLNPDTSEHLLTRGDQMRDLVKNAADTKHPKFWIRLTLLKIANQFNDSLLREVKPRAEVVLEGILREEQLAVLEVDPPEHVPGAALTLEEQKEAKEEYVDLRVAVEWDNLSEHLRRIGLSPEALSFSREMEVTSDRLSKLLQSILEHPAAKDRDLSDLIQFIAELAGKKSQVPLFLCQPYRTDLDKILSSNALFRATLCTWMDRDHMTLPQVLAAHVDTLRHSTDKEIMSRLIRVSADPALNLRPYFFLPEEREEFDSAEDYDTVADYTHSYVHQVYLEWYLFFYDYKSIQETSVAHSSNSSASNSSCSSELVLMSDVFQMGRAHYKSDMSYRTAISWLKKVWAAAKEEVNISGTPYKFFGLTSLEPYALSENSLKTVTDIYRTLSLRSETYLKDEYKKKLEEYDAMKKADPSYSDPPPPLDLYTRLGLIGDYRHPDKGGDPAKFNELESAYKTISDLDQKHAFDDVKFGVRIHDIITDFLSPDEEDDDDE